MLKDKTLTYISCLVVQVLVALDLKKQDSNV